MCTQKPPHDYSEQLYNRYRDAFTRYIREKVSRAVLYHFSGAIITHERFEIILRTLAV